ncbi:MAG TPA: hypothetical protein EYQ80_07930 [Candidatus Poseidoniales archaeon]|nr:hypothetical protein [Candidatus Poseidoniales archaeon]
MNNTYVNNTYVNNTYENNSYSNETFQNQSFQNNSYSNETFQNQTFQNSTSLNQTINEGDLLNQTEPEESADVPSESASDGALTWEPIAVISMMVLLLLINLMHLLKRTPIPSGPPESMLLMTDEMDQVFDQSDEMSADAPSEIEREEDGENDVPPPEEKPTEEETPPTDIGNTTKSEGFEWVEWPAGSGQSYYRPENSGGEWRMWPVE